MKKAKSLTITYLTKASYASLNGSDKEADNISSIKKIRKNDGRDYPYCSSQAIRRALREQLSVLGFPLSEGTAGAQKKGAATTLCDPQTYIDDDLFGFMSAAAKTIKRTSPVRVSPAIALQPYMGDMDFGTNFMSVAAGGNPNIFETEIHSGFYCGTILIELDRIGEVSQGDQYELALSKEEKIVRVLALCDAIQNLWTVGRQSRFLTDMSPKMICAAIMPIKNPVFMESIKLDGNNNFDTKLIENTIADFKTQILASTLGERKGFFEADHESFTSLGKSFEEIRSWIEAAY